MTNARVPDDSRMIARQLARLVFGSILGIGAAVLLSRTQFRGGESSDSLASVLEWTWLAAFIGGLATLVAASYVPFDWPARSLLHASFVVPAAGMALVLPLTVHLGYFVTFGNGLSGFDEWVGLSVLFTGVAHVVFAVMATVRASQLARGKPAISIGFIYACSVAAGMIPFPVIPSLLIAITGLPILPLLYLMKPLANRERAALVPLPRAVARPA